MNAAAEDDELPSVVALGGPCDGQQIVGKIRKTKRVRLADTVVIYYLQTFWKPGPEGRIGSKVDMYVIAGMTAVEAMHAAERAFAEESKP